MASFFSTAISPSTVSLPSTRFFSIMASAAVNTPTKVVPAIIVGGGRVRRALQDMGSGNDVLVKRGNPVPLDFAGPILVCTRNDDLDQVLEATPRSRWSKLGEAPIDGKTDTNPEGLTAAYGKWAFAVAGKLLAGGLSCKVLEKEAFQKQSYRILIDVKKCND